MFFGHGKRYEARYRSPPVPNPSVTPSYAWRLAHGFLPSDSAIEVDTYSTDHTYMLQMSTVTLPWSL